MSTTAKTPGTGDSGNSDFARAGAHGQSRSVPRSESEDPAPKRRAGRPRTSVLSRRLILETGLRLIDEVGAHGVGMRAIAKELGVRPSALYNHVAGQDELVAGVRELISDRIPVDMFVREPWDVALAEWAVGYRRTFAAHPPTIALLAVLPLSEDSVTSQMYDTVISALMRGGWPADRALTLMVALESFILGSALDLAAVDDMMDPGPRRDVPAFSEAYRSRAEHLAARGEGPAEASFQLGLRALFTGFRAEYAALGLAPTSAGAHEAPPAHR
ncbi:TetR family transcriptional regulator [Leucobacter luti]|uniref:TetR family transcriptional regulator n=1 Tax=Leucobacter luti TaxID=340320 RepID=A0A4R6S9H0_9MICO|nr:TetR/AcrR family transcriptional regulator [Leucobacter luti]QYM75224.1 TetR/AcrR family transcriptional regulator [Leucobacter luti]TDP95485.1 TetR family transcriptional regulator [Leucobacter luti]